MPTPITLGELLEMLKERLNQTDIQGISLKSMERIADTLSIDLESDYKVIR